MDANDDLEGREWIGVVGAGLIAAITTALALPSPSHAPNVTESSHVAAAKASTAKDSATIKTSTERLTAR